MCVKCINLQLTWDQAIESTSLIVRVQFAVINQPFRLQTWDNIHSGLMSTSQLEYTTNRQSIQTQKSLNGTNIKITTAGDTIGDTAQCRSSDIAQCRSGGIYHCRYSSIRRRLLMSWITIQATLTSVAGTVQATLANVAPRTAGLKRPLFWFVRLDSAVHKSWNLVKTTHMVSLTYNNNKIRLLTNIDVDFAQFYKNQYRLVFKFEPQNNNQSYTITNLVSYMLHEIFPTDSRFRFLKSLDFSLKIKIKVF